MMHVWRMMTINLFFKPVDKVLEEWIYTYAIHIKVRVVLPLQQRAHQTQEAQQVLLWNFKHLQVERKRWCTLEQEIVQISTDLLQRGSLFNGMMWTVWWQYNLITMSYERVCTVHTCVKGKLVVKSPHGARRDFAVNGLETQSLTITLKSKIQTDLRTLT